MDAELVPDWKPEMFPVGFSAITVNQHTQEWVYTVVPDAFVFKIRRHKDGWYRDKYGAKFSLCAAPVRFHDYNF